MSNNGIMATTKNKYVPRVNQIDAINLNKEITRMIKENLLENLQSISPSIFIRMQPELDLLVQSAIWFGSVGKNFSTFGQQLLVMSYDTEQMNIIRLGFHFVLTILPNYIKVFNERRFSWRVEFIQKTIEVFDNIALILSVLNFFRFLKTGRKPSLVDYILGLDFISLRNNQRRDIGYKYLTRELLWGGFTEMLGFVIPIINIRKLQKIFKYVILGYNAQGKHTIEKQHNVISPVVLTLATNCVYCGERPFLPHHINCGHIYCYFCLVANSITDTNFCCIICNTKNLEGISSL